VKFDVLSKDNKVRTIGISYKQVNEKGEGDIEDTSLLDNIKAVS
jgi:hypothetical protein